jgi:hypothetical protein
MSNNIDYDFIVDALTRYGKHLLDVKTSLEKSISNYDFQIRELENIAERYPERYLIRLEELATKKTEAKTKLAPILEKIAKIPEQISILERSNL